MPKYNDDDDMFKEEDIHKGLSNPETRTFLAKEYARLREQCSQTPEMVQKRIAQIESELAVANERLLIAKQREAIELIASSKGWAIHDIDEDVVEFIEDEYPFIGTEREFNSQFIVPTPADD